MIKLVGPISAREYIMHRLFISMGLDSEIGIYELYDRTMASVRRCLSELGYFIGPSTLEDRSEQLGRGFSQYLTLEPEGQLVATVIEMDQIVLFELHIDALEREVNRGLQSIVNDLIDTYDDIHASVRIADDVRD
ncbi:hypothetical protein BS297_00945 [Rhodococcus erythropolis]|uniref:Uncharacterized protein n=1 Tax=Rhodococcus erythropolis TaxID=1833 RepID=A0A1Q4K750_RHOER|nr:hypothetical protein [Rhodococcus qingshengii]KAB2587278.1 hypothetical protein BS297_00945 [Rhodococcus erythropolis]MCZ4544949.1 hypothetical protein [Rhodococcus qingshengii]OKA15796.1 hypothetical protein BS618_07630 [Rhodococcus erythropolis]